MGLLTPARLVLATYYGVLLVLAFYGCHRLVLLADWWSTRRRPLQPPPAPDDAAWPRVTVQLPLYNERYVAERLMRAVAALDYPRDRLEVQVLDDSTDDDQRHRGRAVAPSCAATGSTSTMLRRCERRRLQGGRARRRPRVAPAAS